MKISQHSKNTLLYSEKHCSAPSCFQAVSWPITPRRVRSATCYEPTSPCSELEQQLEAESPASQEAAVQLLQQTLCVQQGGALGKEQAWGRRTER